MAYTRNAIDERLIDIRTQAESLHTEAVDRSFFSLRGHVKTLHDVRVAAVVDPFTRACFAPECTLLSLPAQGCLDALEAFDPDLLLVESAWRGLDGQWTNKVDRPDANLAALIGYCRARGIPTVFWNKEDPFYFASFFHVASQCDFVFTTDADCVPRYQRLLGHTRAQHMHFAAQPTLHNPIQNAPRSPKACFAGAYYPKHPERSRRMDAYTEFFAARHGIDIYDRHFNDPKIPHQFPASYAPYICGTLSPENISRAYKGYRWGLNLNTETQSQTMFARRVFELMASGTAVVSNSARGLRNYFGDLVIYLDDPQMADDKMKALTGDPDAYDALCLLALRKVLSEHLYQDRLDQLVQAVFGRSLKPALPGISVLSDATDNAMRARIQAQFDAQTYPHKSLHFMPADARVEKSLGSAAFVAIFDAVDSYGPDYLTDLALSTRYSDADAFCKPPTRAQAYTQGQSAWLRRGMARAGLTTGKALRQLASEALCARTLYTDGFSYGEADAAMPQATQPSQRGLPYAALSSPQAWAQDAPPFEVRVLPAASLAIDLMPRDKKAVVLSAEGKGLCVHSDLRLDVTQRFGFSAQYDMSTYADARRLLLRFDITGSLFVRGVCWFFNKDNRVLRAGYLVPGEVRALSVPEGSAYFKLGVYLRGAGDAQVDAITLYTANPFPFGRYFPPGRGLVVTRSYPSAEAPEEGLALSEALQAAQARGVPVDVLLERAEGKTLFREWKGVPILEASPELVAYVCGQLPGENVLVADGEDVASVEAFLRGLPSENGV